MENWMKSVICVLIWYPIVQAISQEQQLIFPVVNLAVNSVDFHSMEND